MIKQDTLGSTTKCPVWSCNEWDPLEEVIVGTAKNAAIPSEHPLMVKATAPQISWDYFAKHAGEAFSADLLAKAEAELDELARVLEGEGIRVRRPDVLDWPAQNGNSAAMARDTLLVLGDEILETPVAWNCRQTESSAYHSLLREYFEQGARWENAPRPRDPLSLINEQANLDDDLFDSVINNDHPCFDAADFMRFGRDIIGQESHVTNKAGIEWLQRHVGDRFRIHVMRFKDSHPMHIDATLVPLRPGLLLVNPAKVDIPALKAGLFKGWEIVPAKQPVTSPVPPFYFTSDWVNMNILMLDHERVLVEELQQPMVQLFKEVGLKPIVLPFRHVNSLGGSFHCATLDIRRRGTLERHLNVID